MSSRNKTEVPRKLTEPMKVVAEPIKRSSTESTRRLHGAPRNHGNPQGSTEVLTNDAPDTVMRRQIGRRIVRLAHLLDRHDGDDDIGIDPLLAFARRQKAEEKIKDLECRLEKARAENEELVKKIEADLTLHARWMEEKTNHDTQKAILTFKDLALAEYALKIDKPLVNPPELGDIIRDSDKDPFWIPGIFPTIFQNETGDPYITTCLKSHAFRNGGRIS